MWYLDMPGNRVQTLSLRLICCTTNNLRDKIPVLSKCVCSGFSKLNLTECCSHSIRFQPRDYVLSLLFYRSLKRSQKAPLSGLNGGQKVKRHNCRAPFHLAKGAFSQKAHFHKRHLFTKGTFPPCKTQRPQQSKTEKVSEDGEKDRFMDYRPCKAGAHPWKMR